MFFLPFKRPGCVPTLLLAVCCYCCCCCVKAQIVPPDDGRPLAWGRYAFWDFNVAENVSRFSLDIKGMSTAVSLEEARVVYESGGSVVSNGLFGSNNLAAITTLQGLSEYAPAIMSNDVMYNFYRYASYQDNDGVFDTNFEGNVRPWFYGDIVVRLAMDENYGASAPLAAQAATVMNVWMMAAVRQCKNDNGNNNYNAVGFIDSAVAM